MGIWIKLNCFTNRGGITFTFLRLITLTSFSCFTYGFKLNQRCIKCLIFEVKMKGKFIVIEGIDGSGKTTQINQLSKWLKGTDLIHENNQLIHVISRAIHD